MIDWARMCAFRVQVERSGSRPQFRRGFLLLQKCNCLHLRVCVDVSNSPGQHPDRTIREKVGKLEIHCFWI